MKYCEICKQDTMFVSVNAYEEVCLVCVFLADLFKGRKFKRIIRKFPKKDD